MKRKNLRRKAFYYLLFIVLGDLVVKYVLIVIIARMIIWKPLLQSFMAALMTLAIVLGLGLIIESFRRFLRLRKAKKDAVTEANINPLWYEVVESAFAFWILLSVGMILATIYNYHLR